MRTLRTARRGLLAALTIGASLVLAGATGATTGSLPGGTSIGAAITSPLDGSTLPAGPVSLTGTAEVGAGVPVANTLLIYVVDVSGSTATVQPTSLCGNESVYDTHPNTTLDCELLAVRNLNAAAIGNGTVARVGAIGFGGGATVGSLADAQILDLSSDAGDAQLIAPDSNVSPVPGPGLPFSFPSYIPTPTNDVQRVLASAYTAGAVTGVPPGWPAPSADGGFMLYSAKEWVGNTNYWAAVERIKTLAATSTLTNKIAVFLSDGASTVGGPANQHVNAALADLAGSGVRIYTYAVGPSALCNPPFPNFGTLEEISVATGTGHCVPLPNPADAVSVVPRVIAAKLTAVRVTIDMGAPLAQATTPTIPSGGLTGPTTVGFTRTLTGLAPGPHTVCVNADGSDGGGAGTIQTCTRFTLQAPPTVSAGPTGGTTDEGTPFTLAGAASGGDTSWAASGGTGTCSFSDAASPTSSVTCTDDGTYTLTLTANDHVNPPVSASTTLTVTNVPPTAALTLSAGPHPLADAVSAEVAISDPGADTFTCSLDWGDGTVTTGTVVGGACRGSHTYAAGGTWIVGATVTDDDGGVGTDSKLVTIDAPPTVTFPTLAPSGDEGSAIPINATTTDDGTTTSHWTATADAGDAPGSSCTIADPSSLTTSATCSDNGTFTLTLAVDDGVNPTVTASETLTVANVAPTLRITDATVSGWTVTVAAAVVDAGANDLLGCSIDWGDGTTSVVPAVCTASHTYTGSGPRTITVTVSDDDGGSSAASTTVTLDQPPRCAAVTTSLATLWPPNGKFVTVTLSGASDVDGDPLAYGIDGVTQDEPVAGAPDAQRLDGSGLQLRAERDGTGDGRVYIVSYSVSDGRLSCAGTVRVTVAHDRAHAAVLSAHSYNSFG